MSNLTAEKLKKYGAVVFIPEAERDNLFGQTEYKGQTIDHFETSDELPGFLAWFSLAGPPPVPPVNVTVPAVIQSAFTLSCTMGEWTGEPTSYSYQWALDGSDVGTDSAMYAVQDADVGKSATCVVTATNAGGSGTAPASNAVIIEAPALSDDKKVAAMKVRAVRKARSNA